MKVGLSLSGGAAKGLVHLGVLEELTKAKVPIDMIGGCSIGALIGAMYAVEPDIAAMSVKLFEYLEIAGKEIIPVNYVSKDGENERRTLFKKISDSMKLTVYYGISLTRQSYLPSEKLREGIASLLPDIAIEDLEIPFACSATDITNYSEYYFTKGSLIDAVVASCSLPGLYPPVHHDGKLLMDGGWSAVNHIDKLRDMGAGFVIASNIIQDLSHYPITTGLDVVIRANNAARHVLSERELLNADIVIQPETCNIAWWDFGAAKECLTIGQAVTKSRANEIKKAIRKKKILRLWWS